MVLFILTIEFKKNREIITRNYGNVTGNVTPTHNPINVVFVGLPAVTVALLCRVVNAAMRFVAGMEPRDHTSNV